MNTVKIPTAIVDVFREAAACSYLSKQYLGGWFPSPRGIMYETKSRKLRQLAVKTLAEVCPDTLVGEWDFDIESGLARKVSPPKVAKPKKPRAKPVATPAAPAAIVPETRPAVVPVKPAVPPKVNK